MGMSDSSQHGNKSGDDICSSHPVKDASIRDVQLEFVLVIRKCVSVT